jgi:filamentous hemagglutinin family protein
MLRTACSLLPVVLFVTAPAVGQVIPDNTLPQNSIVRPGTESTIEGGTIAGNNLFHSFSQFSIPTGEGLYFNNPASIQTIITRVTGDRFSQIDGLIRNNGNSSFVLINPNGIQFGSNASLQLGGAFLASTARSVLFADGSQFVAYPEPTPLLSITTPIGLDLIRSGNITVNGNGSNLGFQGDPRFSPIKGAGESTTGLTVLPRQAIGLIANNVNLDGAILSAPSGWLEIGAVEQGQVFLADLALGKVRYTEGSRFGQITLNNKALLDASGQNGNIHLQGNNIAMDSGATALIQSQGTVGNGQIRVDAAGTFRIEGIAAGTMPSRLVTETIGDERGGNIEVNARNFYLQDGGQLSTRTYGKGAGGDIRLNIRDNLDLSNPGLNSSNFRGIYSIIAAGSLGERAEGKAGNITLNASKINIQQGSSIGSASFASPAEGGDVRITATELNLQGALPSGGVSTIFASTGGIGDAGGIRIDADRLNLSNGGSISSSTGAPGNAGQIVINAAQAIQIDGAVQADNTKETRAGIISVSGSNQLSTAFFDLQAPRTGTSGDITVTTPDLLISNQGRISTTNFGNTTAGKIRVNADRVQLQTGEIRSDAIAGNGGEAIITANSLQLFGGVIKVSSGGTGNGGNILIDTGTVVAFGGTFSADSVGQSGGRIKISTKGLFVDPQTRISATSALGPQFEGQVLVSTAESDLLRGSVEIPQLAEMPELEMSCPNQISQGNQITNIRNGGKIVTAGLRDRRLGWQQDAPTGRSVPKNSSTPMFVEAQGWVLSEDGSNVRFTTTPGATHQYAGQPDPCIDR